MIRKTVLYSGRVQGVGFRNTTQRIALKHEITGFVRNLPDGRVELVAEGPAGEVDRFLAALAERMRDYIQHEHVSETPANGAFRTFDIAYS